MVRKCSLARSINATWCKISPLPVKGFKYVKLPSEWWQNHAGVVPEVHTLETVDKRRLYFEKTLNECLLPGKIPELSVQLLQCNTYSIHTYIHTYIHACRVCVWERGEGLRRQKQWTTTTQQQELERCRCCWPGWWLWISFCWTKNLLEAEDYSE